MIRKLAILSCLLITSQSRGQEKLAAPITPFVDDRTVAVLHADLSRFEVAPLFAQIKQFDLPEKELAALEFSAKTILGQVAKSGLKQVYVVVSLDDVPDSLPLIVVPLGKDADDKSLRMFVNLVDAGRTVRFEKVDDLLLVGSEDTIRRAKGRKATPRPELARALTSVGESEVRLVLLPNDTMRRAFEEVSPTLSKEIGGGPATVLTRGLRWVAIGAKTSPKLEASFTLQASDETAAKAFRGLFESLFVSLGKGKEVREVYPDFDKLTAALVPQQKGDRLTLTVPEDRLNAMIVPAARKLRDAARVSVFMNNLKQIGLAFHNYHEEQKRFPARASFDKQGKPLLSWRVHLLPYLGQEILYKDFKLDEAWDSEHNKKLISRMPKVYVSSPDAALAQAGKTTYFVAVGKGTPFEGDKGTPISKVTDGLANTILVLDAEDERAVVWTKPDDLKVDLTNPARGLRLANGRGFHILLMDGSVMILPRTTSAKNLAGRMTHAGGEIIGQD